MDYSELQIVGRDQILSALFQSGIEIIIFKLILFLVIFLAKREVLLYQRVEDASWISLGPKDV